MAPGRVHDRATLHLALPYGLLWWPWLGPAGAALAGACFLAGGLWLSPDLDTRSRALGRWGPLAGIWAPYRRLLAHRSLGSHGPLIGTALRLSVLLLWAVALAALLRLLGVGDGAGRLLQELAALGRRHPAAVLCAAVSLEASAWLHLLLDGDPAPAGWRRRRRGRRTTRREEERPRRAP
jgi:uncharacterized metal-binding protein